MLFLDVVQLIQIFLCGREKGFVYCLKYLHKILDDNFVAWNIFYKKDIASEIFTLFNPLCVKDVKSNTPPSG